METPVGMEMEGGGGVNNVFVFMFVEGGGNAITYTHQEICVFVHVLATAAEIAMIQNDDLLLYGP